LPEKIGAPPVPLPFGGNIYQSESHVLSLQNYVRQSYDASSSVKKAPIQTRVPDAVESVGQLEVELLRSPLHELGTSGTSKWI
jgi:hypothetical protein